MIRSAGATSTVTVRCDQYGLTRVGRGGSNYVAPAREVRRDRRLIRDGRVLPVS
jgi:hypothetical protein